MTRGDIMFDRREDSLEEILDLLPIGVMALDGHGSVKLLNTQAVRFLSIKKDIGYMRLEEVCPLLYKDGRLKEEVVLEDGSMKISCRITSGKWKNYDMVFLEEDTGEKELTKENALFRTILDSVHEGVEISNSNGVMVFFNAACEKFEGMKAEDVIGRKITDVYDVTEESSTHLTVQRTGREIIEKQHSYHTRDGQQVDVIASTYPYFTGKDAAYVYSINRDVTKMKEFLAKTIELQKRLNNRQQGGKAGNGAYFIFDDIIGNSKAIRDVIAAAKKVAPNNSSVLIYGETGTGKELFAQSIHNASLNANGPFIAINCAAIPESLLESLLFGTVKGAFTGAVESQGLFEQAENGTLYLDEINSMGMHLQAKLLRVLQEKTIRRIGDSVQRNVNCRIISSTNKEPLNAVNDQQIRKDLYYRLSTVTIYIPPLAGRIEDISALSGNFVKKYNRQFSAYIKHISKQLQDAFNRYSWPGNVRELEHVIESAFNMVDPGEDTLELGHLAVYLRKRFIGQNSRCLKAEPELAGSLSEILMDVEKRTIIQSLRRNSGNISQTARELGIFRQALQYRIKRYNINPESLTEQTP